MRLVAVTKTEAVEAAVELARLGQLDLGENRVDELERKRDAFAREHASLASEVRWHMIGHLQRNKARRAVRHAATVHSVDTLELLDTLERVAGEENRPLEVFLEVRAVDGDGRSGFEASQIPEAAERAAASAHVRLLGLMAMAAVDRHSEPGKLETQERARRTFAAVRELAERLPRAHFGAQGPLLSMGMSSDLEAALAEGAHVVRIGTALFETSEGRGI